MTVEEAIKILLDTEENYYVSDAKKAAKVLIAEYMTLRSEYEYSEYLRTKFDNEDRKV